MSLTPNQKETLHALLYDRATGQVAKPIDSLIRRGLIVRIRTTLPYTPRTPMGATVLSYELTPLGYETYVKMRTKWQEERVARLQAEFEKDLQQARWRLAVAEKVG